MGRAVAAGASKMAQRGFKSDSGSRINRNKHGTGVGMTWLRNEGGEDGLGLADPPDRIVPDMRPTVLIAGERDRTSMLARWAERAGLRCLGTIPCAQAPERLARTALLDLLLLDLRGVDAAHALDRAQARAIATRYGLGGTRLAVIADLAGLDGALAQLDGPGVDFLCDPADSDIVTLLVMAGLSPARDGRMRVADPARESDAARIERLSDEVRRLAVTIERLAEHGLMASEDTSVMAPRGAYRAQGRDGALAAVPGDAPSGRPRGGGAEEGDDPLTHADVRAIIRARRMRDQYLPADLFADPAWDMMLDLLAARLSSQRVSVSSLCIASAVPPTTALRWIRQLTERAVFARIDDPADGRRVFIELTDEAAGAVAAWAQAVRRNGGVLPAPGR